MAFSKKDIITNSKNLYSCMRKMNHYSLEELQNMINLKNTDLCLALIQLIQDKKVERGKDKNGVYYFSI